MIHRSYPRERVEDVLVELSLQEAYRIFPVRFIDTPLDTVPSNSRYSTVDGDFAVLYAARDLATAFVELIVRDRFAGRGRRELHYSEISRRAVAKIATHTNAQLTMLDLRDDGCVRLGTATDSVGARNHAAGRALGRAIHREHPDVDGLVWESRFTGAEVFGVLDRAIGKLRAELAIPLRDHGKLPGILERYKVSLIRTTN